MTLVGIFYLRRESIPGMMTQENKQKKHEVEQEAMMKEPTWNPQVCFKTI
jgi:hypothetical protein